jgi:hypothetical protein
MIKEINTMSNIYTSADQLIGKTPPDGSRPAGNGSESGSLGSRLAKMKVAQNKTVERSEELYFKKG